MKLPTIPARVGVVLIAVFAIGSTIADSVFRLLSVVYDGVFAVLIVAVALAMIKKEKPPEG